MISRMNFRRKHKSFDFLDRKKYIYAIASEIRKDICYAADNTRFCVIDYEGLIFCPLEEVPVLADKCVPDFKKEILEVYRDILDMKRMEIIYA